MDQQVLQSLDHQASIPAATTPHITLAKMGLQDEALLGMHKHSVEAWGWNNDQCVTCLLLLLTENLPTCYMNLKQEILLQVGYTLCLEGMPRSRNTCQRLLANGHNTIEVIVDLKQLIA